MLPRANLGEGKDSACAPLCPPLSEPVRAGRPKAAIPAAAPARQRDSRPLSPSGTVGRRLAGVNPSASVRGGAYFRSAFAVSVRQRPPRRQLFHEISGTECPLIAATPALNGSRQLGPQRQEISTRNVPRGPRTPQSHAGREHAVAHGPRTPRSHTAREHLGRTRPANTAVAHGPRTPRSHTAREHRGRTRAANTAQAGPRLSPLRPIPRKQCGDLPRIPAAVEFVEQAVGAEFVEVTPPVAAPVVPDPIAAGNTPGDVTPAAHRPRSRSSTVTSSSVTPPRRAPQRDSGPPRADSRAWKPRRARAYPARRRPRSRLS